MNTITNRMSGDEAALWTAISTFEIDGADTPALPFAARLARENGWNAAYTQRVLQEYRKFLFLCCQTDTGVTPSDAVDQAWHLHLTYTRSYWLGLCRNTLGRELHHNPTKGGTAEGQKFDGMYSDTARLYQHYFGETPPPDIWPANAQRFSDIDFERVNRRTHWVLPKIRFSGTSAFGIGILLSAVVLLFVQANFSSGLTALAIVGVLLVIFIVSAINANSDTDEKSRRQDGGGGVGCGGDASSDGGDAGGGDSGCSSGCSGCGSGCGS
jgi:hypothetical protein